MEWERSGVESQISSLTEKIDQQEAKLSEKESILDNYIDITKSNCQNFTELYKHLEEHTKSIVIKAEKIETHATNIDDIMKNK